jgi:hypothetical protein
MLNKAPIFLNCFSRGGSNILWNIFLTHPDVCSPMSETLQIFGAGLRHATPEGYLVALLSGQPRLFDQWNLSPRRPLPRHARWLIDRTFHRWKLKTLRDRDMRFKYEDEVYTEEEVRSARLAAKNNNGLVYLSEVLLDLYPDATFVSLVRNPLALYEGHRRHRLAESPEQFARFYERVAARMIEDEARLPNYHIVRFEDLLADPVGVTEKLYGLAGLDFGRVRKMRFKAKPHLQADGRHATPYVPGRHYWFEPGEVNAMLEPRINDYQAERVDKSQRGLLAELTQKSLRHFAYA